MNTSELISSIAKCRCPQCQIGLLFTVKNPYNLLAFWKMPTNCLHCDLEFELEAGFWYGAMYLTYLIGTIILAPLLLLLNLYIELSFIKNIVLISTVLAVLTPLLVRYSRSIWIHLFVCFLQDK